MLYNVVYTYGGGRPEKLLTAADSKEEAIEKFHEAVFDFVFVHNFDAVSDELEEYAVIGVEDAGKCRGKNGFGYPA